MDNKFDDTTFFFFFCNLDYRNGLNTYAVQVNIPIKKRQQVDKICKANIS